MHTTSPTTFLLIRHAETVWNKEQRHTGNIEVELSDRAAHQITRLTRLLTPLDITAVYSSPLSRCRITILPTSDFFDVHTIVDERLVERDLGAWEGKHSKELLPDHPGYEFPQSAYNGQFHIPGAETLEHLEHRLRECLHEMHAHHAGKTIAISTHSGVIWTILHHIVINPPETFFWPGNCSITTLSTEGNHYTFVDFKTL